MRRPAKIVKGLVRVRICGAFLAASLAALTSVADPAHACILLVPIELAQIRQADVVVMGRISNYAIIRDAFSQYAQFDVLADGVVVGEAPETLTVMWENSTFELPDSMPSGPFLIALRDLRPSIADFKASGATLPPGPEPAPFLVLQAPCSDPFMFKSGSDSARAALEILHR